MTSNGEDDDSFTSTLSLQLVTYSAVKTGKGLKKRLVLKKDVRVKTKLIEFTFTMQDDNYLLFQNDILRKYGFHTCYKSTSKHFFPVKIHIPPKNYDSCSQVRVKEVPDIENSSEYVELAKQIVKDQPQKDITVLIDMQKIELFCKVH
ncbi:hypothetical protein BT96DRAFT_945366 [Gymnopus androsaceus JB14]|uniref:Uncharacterized protein n=1 Tax=Gymnopus androsaceus JB14 TaxID=1447944 RepID=A0A6A4GZP3_9AGAR|nr:hypothetical protein BT96DRAFT_945366 [Gymnopus androsaceus JB14]